MTPNLSPAASPVDDAFEGRAPMLPIETSLVTATLAVVEAKAKIDLLLLLIQHVPRDAEQAFGTFNATWNELRKAHEHLSAYHQIRSCQGSA